MSPFLDDAVWCWELPYIVLWGGGSQEPSESNSKAVDPQRMVPLCSRDWDVHLWRHSDSCLFPARHNWPTVRSAGVEQPMGLLFWSRLWGRLSVEVICSTTDRNEKGGNNGSSDRWSLIAWSDLDNRRLPIGTRSHPGCSSSVLFTMPSFLSIKTQPQVVPEDSAL